MEHKPEVETILLKIVEQLNEDGEKMYKSLGNESYIDRCHNHDAKTLIYRLTNKYKKEQDLLKQLL